MWSKSLLFWKFLSIALASILLAIIILWISTNKTQNEILQSNLLSEVPHDISFQNNELPYPVSFFRLQRGTVAIETENDQDSLIQNFILTLTPHVTDSQGVRKIKIALDNIDSVGTPKISHKENYGCVTVGASGYSGYYIFSLPSGIQIGKGEQYSECVEWLSDTKVLIVEEPYGKNFVVYSIFDVLSKTKTPVSQFSTN